MNKHLSLTLQMIYSIIYAKRYFHRSINAIFGKIGRLDLEG